jgi:hypothetical protein
MKNHGVTSIIPEHIANAKHYKSQYYTTSNVCLKVKLRLRCESSNFPKAQKRLQHRAALLEKMTKAYNRGLG